MYLFTNEYFHYVKLPISLSLPFTSFHSYLSPSLSPSLPYSPTLFSPSYLSSLLPLLVPSLSHILFLCVCRDLLHLPKEQQQQQEWFTTGTHTSTHTHTHIHINTHTHSQSPPPPPTHTLFPLNFNKIFSNNLSLNMICFMTFLSLELY